MNQNGWRIDSRWTGDLSNGARWTRQAEDGTPLWATIEFVRVADETYNVSYRQMLPR